MPIFERPASLEFPQTFYTFKAKDKGSDKVVEYRVQDLPESHFDEAVSMLVNFFLPDEEICTSRGVLTNKAAIKEMSGFWESVFKERLSIACFKNDGSDELVSMNVLIVASKNDPKEESNYQDQAMIDVMSVLTHISQQVNVFEQFGVDQYLTAYGLVVNPAYRGRGIATEMLKARVPILKALGLTVTSTIFTGIGSQIAAKKAGYEDVYAARYSELKNLKEQFNFLNTKAEFCKILALKI